MLLLIRLLRLPVLFRLLLLIQEPVHHLPILFPPQLVRLDFPLCAAQVCPPLALHVLVDVALLRVLDPAAHFVKGYEAVAVLESGYIIVGVREY